MDKSKINLILDALMFVCMMAIAGLGFLMKFILIPGVERWDKYGRNVELMLLGMNRHELGKIHLTIALVLLGALVLHIYLHWKMIVGIFQKLITAQSTRRIVAAVFIAACAVLIALPFAVKPEVQEIGRGQGRIAHSSLEGTEAPIDNCGACPLSVPQGEETRLHAEHATEHATEHTAEHVSGSIEVRGYMTLNDVAEKSGVPADHLKEKLGISASASGNDRLGWLRDDYDFTMDDVEKVIEGYTKSQ